MADTNKETIYIDVDDDITSIIDKVRASKHKITALVLPKRATTLQSIVNMRLLKRTAESANKNLVLITSEASLLPLAGAVGLHVARTLQSKPAIPAPPEVAGAEALVDEDETPIDKSKSVGELSGDDSSSQKSSSSKSAKTSTEETIDIDNTDDLDTELPDAPKSKKKKKSKVPNFEKFRLRLILGGLGIIILIIGLIFAMKVLPKAKITITTTGKTYDSSFNFTASTDAKDLDTKEFIVPAQSKTTKSTDTQKVTATGQKNVGNKASGSVSLQNCSASTSTVTVPSGTAISTNGISFVTQKSVTLPATTLNGLGGCTTPTADVNVLAANPGTSGNISSGNAFIVSGYDKVTGSNSAAFAGGTDKNVTVVSQKDVDNAVNKIVTSNDGAKNDLKKMFSDEDLFGLDATIIAGKPSVSSSPAVGLEASEVTVTTVTEYKMLGVKQSDLEKLVDDNLKSQLEADKQSISDYGLKDATFKIASKTSDNVQKLAVSTQAFTGAKLDEDALKNEITGKKSGEVKQLIQNMPSVESVKVDYSPFWVTKAPKPSKITIVIEKSTQSSDAGTN